MVLFFKSSVRHRVATAFVLTSILCIAILIWQSPSGGGMNSAMFTSSGTVKDISRDRCFISIEVESSRVFDRGSIVTFDFSNHPDELEKAQIEEAVSVHHWLDSRDGKAIIARSLSVEPTDAAQTAPS